MLHVTNGDRAAEFIGQTGLGGIILPWRDVLHEGPVGSGHPLDGIREMRARFLADMGWEPFDETLDVPSRRDALLREPHDVVNVLFDLRHAVTRDALTAAQAACKTASPRKTVLNGA